MKNTVGGEGICSAWRRDYERICREPERDCATDFDRHRWGSKLLRFGGVVRRQLREIRWRMNAMRRFLGGLAALLLVVSAVGCGAETEETADTPAATGDATPEGGDSSGSDSKEW